MAAHVKGSLSVKVGEKTYKLFVGMSVLADLQSKHGQDVLERLEAPAGASAGWMPDLNIVQDLFAGALERHHEEEITRWLVDDIIAENGDAFGDLMGASFPEPTPEKAKPKKLGNAKRPKKATA